MVKLVKQVSVVANYEIHYSFPRVHNKHVHYTSKIHMHQRQTLILSKDNTFAALA
jgi:hypothetical protein